MNDDSLKCLIKSNKVPEAVQLINEIAKEKNYSFVSFLIKLLQDTDNNILRNAAAMALADLGSNEAVPILIKLLESTSTIGSRGTLLFALEHLECSEYVDTFIHLLSDKNFEVSSQSLQILRKIGNQIPPDKKNILSKLIEEKLTRLEEEYEILEEALGIFRVNKNE